MKSSRLKSASRSRLVLACLLFAASALLAAGVARASAELDRRYSLDSVGALRSLDNVDGLFTDYVSKAIREYFAGHPRFVLQDVSRADAVLEGSKLEYSKLIDDPKVLAKLAHATRSATLIRTKIFKEGLRYRFTLDWLLAPRMDVLASDVFFLEEPARGQALGAEEIASQLQASLERLIAKVPFVGQVTGRDQSTVTLSVGEELNLRKGDVLVVGTLEEVKRHPLLGTIAEWRTVQTGRLEVEQVDRSVTFARITEEEAQRPVARYNKILSVTPKPDPVVNPSELGSRSSEAMPDRTDPPRYGWVSAGPLVGMAGRQSASADGLTGKSGSGFGAGARADAQIWLNRRWFVEAMFAYGYSMYSQSDIASGSASTSSPSLTLYQQKLGVGYSYLAGSDFFAAKSYVKLGTETHSYTLPRDAAELTNPVSFGGLYLGLGGDLPLRGAWGAQLDLNFGLTGSVTETSSPLGNASSSTRVDFYAGVFKRLKPRFLFRVGVDFAAHGAEYTGGATLSQNMLSIYPSWVMLF